MEESRFLPLTSLVAEKHDVVPIEQDEAVLNHIVSRLISWDSLQNGADFAILEQAGVQECDIFIALTEHDEVIWFQQYLLKKWALKTIVRVRNSEYPMPTSREKYSWILTYR